MVTEGGNGELDDEFSRFCVHQLASTSESVSDLLTKLSLTEADIQHIERHTVGQNDNVIWKLLRRGRLTASNFYRVHTKVETVRKNPMADCAKLVTSLLNPDDISHLPQIRRGIESEREAVQTVVRILSESHTNVELHECGLFLCSQHPYLGASPDGLLTCNCCQPTLLEVKCPTADLTSLPYLDSSRQLREKSSYYGQIQGQMAITKIERSYFFVYKNNSEHHLQVVTMNKEFVEKMINNLQYFFTVHMVPAMLDQPTKKKRKHVILIE